MLSGSQSNQFARKVWGIYSSCLKKNNFTPLLNYLTNHPQHSCLALNNENETIIHLLCKLPLETFLENSKTISSIVRFHTQDPYTENLSSRSTDGSTPLHYAVEAANPHLVAVLVQSISETPDPSQIFSLKNNSQNTPLAAAFYQENEELEQSLLKAMGNKVGDQAIPPKMTIKDFILHNKLALQGNQKKFIAKRSPVVNKIANHAYCHDNEVLNKVLEALATIENKCSILKNLIELIGMQHIDKNRSGEQAQVKIYLVQKMSQLKPFRDDRTAIHTVGSNEIIVATEDPDGNPKSIETIVADILHEATHFICLKVFENEGNPFYPKDGDEPSPAETEFAQALQSVKQGLPGSKESDNQFLTFMLLMMTNNSKEEEEKEEQDTSTSDDTVSEQMESVCSSEKTLDSSHTESTDNSMDIPEENAFSPVEALPGLPKTIFAPNSLARQQSGESKKSSQEAKQQDFLFDDIIEAGFNSYSPEQHSGELIARAVEIIAHVDHDEGGLNWLENRYPQLAGFVKNYFNESIENYLALQKDRLQQKQMKTSHCGLFAESKRHVEYKIEVETITQDNSRDDEELGTANFPTCAIS